ncbi:MAG TPA: two-component regulator propeller domain-containing protein [Acidobacteriaceae bacterium]|nr:two-component regulator propeller domain-containing protein [Acidobacteriaceae bacterium]
MRITRYIAVSTLLFCALSAWCLDPHQSLQHYGFQSWQADNGLPQNTVHAVLQTRDGFVWLATEAGLVRFDSVNFDVFTNKTTPQIPSGLIFALMEDRSGALWIGTANGVVRYSAGRFRDFPETAGTAVWSLFQDREGRIWATGSSGLSRLDGERFVDVPGVPLLDEKSRLTEPLDGSLWLSTTEGLFHAAAGNATYFTLAGAAVQIEAIALDRKGHVWAGTQNGVETCSPSAIGVNCRPFVALAGKDVRAITVAPAGGIWMGGDKGLWFYDPDQPQTQLRAYTEKDGLPSARVNLLFCDRAGAIWIATSGGIARFFDGTLDSRSPREGFSVSTVLSVTEDREGDLWFGTESSGVDILRDRPFTTYGVADGITDDHILSIAQDRGGKVWLGTNGGGLDFANLDSIANTGFHALTASKGLSSNIILSIAVAPNGDLWVGTPDGLDRIHNSNVTVFTSADGLADDFARSLYFDSQGTLWIGTRRGLSQFRDGKFATWTTLDGLGSNLVGAMTGTNDGGLWIGTLNGLTRMRNGKFRNYTTHDGLSNNVVTTLHQDSDGTLWIGTDGGGLTRWQNDTFKPVSTKGAALPANVYSILANDNDDLWLGSNTGIYRVNRNALNRYVDGAISSVRVERYGITDGMNIGEVSSGGHPAAYRLHDGALWFATLKGVATVDPVRLDSNRVPPLIAIERFSVNDQPQLKTTGSATLKIPAGARRFAFEYAGLSFVAPSKVRFRYKLDGFDHQWIDAGSQRSAYYTNLPPGHYTFRVIAANNDGVWSPDPASLAFQLQPYFYQTIWFYVLLAIVIALIAYLIYLWRVRHVESRYKAVLAERSRIAREIHDTLAQGFVALSVQLQIVGRSLPNSPQAAQQYLDEAQELARTGLDDARRAIWELRSQSAENDDFASRLKQMADRVTAQSGLKTQIEVHGAYRPISETIESELLRVAQEAVTNVVRHAAASQINIQLHFSRRHVKMTIADNGRGFPAQAPSAADGHFGIIGMRERVQQMGGHIEVSSRPGEGTQVQVDVATGSEAREK